MLDVYNDVYTQCIHLMNILNMHFERYRTMCKLLTLSESKL